MSIQNAGLRNNFSMQDFMNAAPIVDPNAGYSQPIQQPQLSYSGSFQPIDYVSNAASIGSDVSNVLKKTAPITSTAISTLGNIASGAGIVTGLISAGMGIYNAYQQRKADREAARIEQQRYDEYTAKEESRYQDAKSAAMRNETANTIAANRTNALNQQTMNMNKATNAEAVATSKMNRKEQALRNRVSMMATMMASMMAGTNNPQSRAAISAVRR